MSKDDSTPKTLFSSQDKNADAQDKGSGPPQQRAKRSLTFDSLPSFAASFLRHTSRQNQDLPGVFSLPSLHLSPLASLKPCVPPYLCSLRRLPLQKAASHSVFDTLSSA